MSKVFVDRELLCQALGGGVKGEHARSELRGMLSRAQPAEAEGVVEMGTDAWMALHLLDRMDTSADEEPRVGQVEEIVRRMGAALSAVTAERDRLQEQANKFRHVERAMEALGCDEREGGIVTAASLILISSAHRMNAKRGVIDQEGVTLDGGCIGDWRVTIERISPAMAAKEA
jgi:hypothetical protein